MKNTVKKYIPYIVPGAVFLMLLILNLFCYDHWLDSDMAAEMNFSRLLSEEGHFFAAPGWYYSTEFRFLYTHWIMGPLFHVLSDWHVIRAVTNILSYVLMLASYYYFMKPLGVRRSLVILSSVMLLLPFSETMVLHMVMGNTYMFHVIIVFLFFGLFLRLAQLPGSVRAEEKEAAWQNVARVVCFLILAVICGVSGVRYLLALQCPLVLTAFVYLLRTEDFQEFRGRVTAGNLREELRTLCKSARMKPFWYSLIGVLGSMAGYLINVVYVSRKYVFQTYDSTNFIAVYQGVLFERMQNAIGSLLMLFGYIPDRSVLSLRGVISLTAFALLALFAFCVAKTCKKEQGKRFFVGLFLVVSLALNLFVFIFTTSTMVPRYYITIFIFALPAVCFYLEGEKLPFDRFVFSLLLIGCLTSSSAKTVMSYLTVDKNESRRAVAEFLQERGYDFGYATYWNANIVTELTNGDVEIAHVGDPVHLDFFKWSSPVKYYEPGYHSGEVFLLLTAEEAAEAAGTKAVSAGRRIYGDGNYEVLLYDSSEDLLSLAESW